MTPRVSVLMAVYNGGKYVKQSVESVLTQDMTDLEFVIVDDNSTDDTRAIVEAFGDARVRMVRNERNMGQTRSLNRALSMATAPLVARIDADDAYLPGKLSRQLAFMDSHPEVVVCGTWAEKIDAEGQVFGLYAPPIDRNDIRFAILHGVPLCHVSVMMRRELVLAHGGYDGQFPYAADFDLWSRLFRCGMVLANIPDVLMQYRQFEASLGAVQKVGPAGHEAARIIEENFRSLTGVPISTEIARSIALLYFPAAELTAAQVADAYDALGRAAREIYGRRVWRVRMRLAGMLAWSLWRQSAHSRWRATRHEVSFVRRWAGDPLALGAVAAVGVAGFVPPARILRAKEAVMSVAGRRRPGRT